MAKSATQQAPTTAEPEAKVQTKKQTEFQRLLEKGVSYKPYGERDEIVLDPRTVYQYLVQPTKQGKMPSLEDCTRFCMLCQARELNPWAGDAWLLGYDTKDGPKFECITAVAALLKRAEANDAFDGMQMGVILATEDGEVFREGDYVGAKETLVGGWCKAYRKDRKFPFYAALKLTTYKKAYGRWSDDAAGMIVKCAKAAALRNAFPTQLGGLYLKEEKDFEAAEYTDATHDVKTAAQTTSRSERLAGKLKGDQQQEGEPESFGAADEEETQTPPEDAGNDGMDGAEDTAGPRDGASTSDHPPDVPKVLQEYANCVHQVNTAEAVRKLEKKWVLDNEALSDDELEAGKAMAAWKIAQLGGE